MNLRRTLIASMTATLVLGAAAPSYGATKYKNCTALNKVYPHGVGKKAAKDHTSGKRVTNYKVSNDVYAHNDGGSKRYSGEHDLDRDNDGIACEKR